MPPYTFQQKVFLSLLAVVTIAFGWILAPYGGAIFWGVVLAILFAPVYRWLLQRTRNRANLASMLTLLLILVMVILPLTLVSISIVNQAASVVELVRSGEITVGGFFNKIMAALPNWLVSLLDRFHLTSLSYLQDKLTEAAPKLRATSQTLDSTTVSPASTSTGKRFIGQSATSSRPASVCGPSSR